jgi:hypothetical protein
VRLQATLLLALAAAPALALAGPAPAPASDEAVESRSVAGLESDVADAEARLAAMVARAKVDFRVERVRRYREMTPQQLADPLRGVAVDELLGYLADEKVPAEVREEAAAAIGADVARRVDPDLSDEGRGAKRPRAAFSMKLVPLLTGAKDLQGRSLAKTLLEALWPGTPAREPDVAAYDPRKKDTWWEARRAWEKHLKRER